MTKRLWVGVLLVAGIAGCGGGGGAPAPPPAVTGVTSPAPTTPDLTPHIVKYLTTPGQPYNAPPKTDYWAAPRTTDPITLDTVNDKGRYRNPSVYGTFALPPATGDFSERRTHFDANCNQPEPLSELQLLAGKRMLETATALGEAAIWTYDFPALGPDFIVEAPYPSSYSQAINIHGLWFLFCKSGDVRYRDLAIRAAKAMTVPIRQGGVLNDFDGEYWFEELVTPSGYNAYILNAHLYSIAVLYMTAEFSGDPSFRHAAEKGVVSLNRLLPQFETPDGWTKYDLRPPSPVLYAELHTANGDAVRKITATSTNGDSYTLCELACNQTLASARANNAYRFNINLPSLREYHAKDFTIFLSAETEGAAQFYVLTRKPESSLYAVATPELHTQHTGWGQTPAAYQVWHAMLMAEIASWTGLPLHAQTAQRWQQQSDAFQRAQ